MCFCLGLIKINKFFLRKTNLVNEEIRGIKASKSQRDYRGCHPNATDLYRAEITDNGFNILKTLPDGEVIKYEMLKNEFTCNKALCLVNCPQCPSKLCVHDFSCTCRQYAYG